jgi:lipoprotein-anchoring transpeptidase ErfK/SrfK
MMFQFTNRILLKSLMAVAILGEIGDRATAQVPTQPSIQSASKTSLAPEATDRSSANKLIHSKSTKTSPAIDRRNTATSAAQPTPGTTNNKSSFFPNLPPANTSNPNNTAKGQVTEPIKLVLKLTEKQVYVYQGEQVLNKYPVAIGKAGWETPIGEWKVLEMIKNPGWTNFKNGKVIKPGPQNPLGERWIGFWTDGKDTIGFHGTPDVKSVGTAASHGCVRMFNQDVRVLFDLVKVGTPVQVVR